MRYSKKGEQVYFDCPGLGLRGRRRGTGCGERLLGLDSLLTDPSCKQATVLDCGCAEGLIGLEFAQRGAAVVHGFDLQDVSIDAALKLFEGQCTQYAFRQADLSAWTEFTERNADLLLDRYDIVLLLGLYHHLLKQAGIDRATAVFEGCLALCDRYLAVRTNAPIPQELVSAHGFREAASHPGDQAMGTGRLMIFERL